MSKIKLRPLDDRVVVEPLEAEERTAGGIVLPDSAKEKPQRGTVIAVGPGRLLETGKRGDLSVQEGDEVIYGKYGGTDIKVNGQEVKLSLIHISLQRFHLATPIPFRRANLERENHR